MKKKDSNKSLVGVVVLILILLVGWSLFSKTDSDLNVDADQNQEQSDDSSEVTKSVASKTVAKKTYYKKPVAKKTESTETKEEVKTEVPTSNSTGLSHDTNAYLEARDAFGNYKLQVADCAVSPTALVVKKGSSILVDGFSSSLQTVYIGETMVALGPNEAKPVALNHIGTWGVDCKVDGRSTYNGATIRVVE